MNASEKRILKLAIILFTIGLIVRYLPWGLPSIESFEVGEAVVVANSPPSTHEKANLATATPEVLTSALEKNVPSAIGSADPSIVANKVDSVVEPGLLEHENRSAVPNNHRKSKKKVKLPLHINSASVDDLCALNGVGPKLAEKIIERRNASGPFKNASDLKKVHGIGKKKLENMLQSIIFD
jgi:competence protein ComEA